MGKRWRWLLIGFISLAVIGVIYWLYLAKQERDIEPQTLLEETLQNMAAAKSFRYKLESTLTIDDRREVVSRIQGEKDDSGSTHIKGEMVKTPIDIYHIKDTTYNWDSSSKKWLVIKDAEADTRDVLIAELDPLSNLNFKSISQVEKLGFEKVGGTRCFIISCRPSIENELMEVALKDFRYKLWVDYRQKYIRRATLSAVSKNNPNARLTMKVEFFDFNQDIRVQKPELN
ncbi:MAG TPA: hypothetical protein GXX39_08590 [Syntrophothermus lipocalidus]|uniref:hypothetical protein n=1 Tax=Syntrophothermus sp. TaxID=2736299 RepID=UPI00180A5E8E|nr:hypothetical protein [Syntrophothermus sp.]NSW82935.1 hypothetical protein [Syntrophothermus sp.]HHV77411.1 hypothetical protein [Syntrophothermus lipocalidus]HOV42346.1 hypothetical protein [Syntrophothermus lipocalidus]